MRIAFYAPLKPRDHPVPSGDREMARLLMRALAMGGHEVEIASTMRSFRTAPSLDELNLLADAERSRIATHWQMRGAPDLWFCYHPYYKAPDLIGPDLARRVGIPYVTAESSYSPKRDNGPWAESQALVAAAARQAALNICFTVRDESGLQRLSPVPATALLSPFIDADVYAKIVPAPEPGRLLTVAMMRSGDKLASFTMLAAALRLLADVTWTLTIVGDGPHRHDVEALMEGLSCEFAGEFPPSFLQNFYQKAEIYLWPGCGEAYGLAYLEAQAAGLPVVAQHTAGVPAVVIAGETGILTPEGDVEAYANAIRRLLLNEAERRDMAARARRFVLGERSLTNGSERLNSLLASAV